MINIESPIVIIWFKIVENVKAIDFNCALNNWNSSALIATGMINIKIQSKYTGEILKKE